MGNDGSLLYRVDGREPGETFGTAVCGIGDLEGDGLPDVVVGIGCTGGARAFSGGTGELIWSAGAASGEAWDVVRLRAVGDLDGDGIGEVVLGQRGAVEVLSGRNGSTLGRVQGARFEGFGTAVEEAGDLDGDGFPELLVGEPGAGAGGGRIHIVSTNGMAFLGTVDRPNDLWSVGCSLAALGDLDGDGTPDFAVGAESSLALEPSRALVVSGLDRGVLMELRRDCDTVVTVR